MSAVQLRPDGESVAQLVRALEWNFGLFGPAMAALHTGIEEAQSGKLKA